MLQCIRHGGTLWSQCLWHVKNALHPACRLLHDPPNTLELRLLEAESADHKFKLQAAEGQLAAERQRAAAAEQAAAEARRGAEQAEERLVAALGRRGLVGLMCNELV